MRSTTGKETGGNRGQTGRSPIFRRMEIGERPVCPQFFNLVQNDQVQTDRIQAHPTQTVDQAEGGTGMASERTSVDTETCGHVSPLKFRLTICEY